MHRRSVESLTPEYTANDSCFNISVLSNGIKGRIGEGKHDNLTMSDI